MAEQKKLEKIKTSVFSRSLRLAKLTATTGMKLTGYGASNLMSELISGKDTKKERWQSLLKERAGHLSQNLGELKGSLMKAGQMLSMYGEHFLPAEANDILKTLQSKSPPLAWSAIERALKEGLTAAQLDQLEIDHEPLGSASLGQVHGARIKATGERIVLKIQYPGVGDAIDSDLKALRSFLNLLKLLPKDLNTDSLFSEVRLMLAQEMDYELEAQQTQAYAELLKNDRRFIVPQIYPQFSSKKVIASSFEQGLSPDDPLVLSLIQDRRNRLALNFVDLFFTELFQWGLIQTDPHLGNYRVRLSANGEDQLILLDFGAVRKYSDNFLRSYRKMIQTSLESDSAGLIRAASELKFIMPDDSPDLLLAFEKFCFATVEPFMAPEDPRNTRGHINLLGEYNWKNSDLPQRLTKEGFRMVQNFKLRPPPQEILFLDRKTAGVFIFCSVMRAEINSRKFLTKHF
jgi:predicted unusual protein kinase regulating ubiquinone biosynthesis (AarF/ABC1/UbiB family)